MTRNIQKSSVENAGFEIISRFVTFGINSFLLHHSESHVWDMIARLVLLESTLIFLCRELISRPSLSTTTQKNNENKWPQIINQIWTTVPLSFILSALLLYICLEMFGSMDFDVINNVGVYTTQTRQYEYGCYAIALSCIIQMCAEAPVFIAQVFCFVKLKLAVVTMSLMVRSMVFIILISSDKKSVACAFGIAQLCSALTIFIGYYGLFHIYIKKLENYRLSVKVNDDNDKRLTKDEYKDMDEFPFNNVQEMFPGALPNSGDVFNSDWNVLVWSFTKHRVVELVLTKSAEYIMFLASMAYDKVHNVGSMAAPLIFRHIEDNTSAYFAQTITRDVQLIEQSQDKFHESGEYLSNACKVVTSIGLMVLVFGQSYSGTLLLCYGESDLVSGDLAEFLLQWYCVAIVLSAIKGTTEGSSYIYKKYRPIGLNPLYGILPGKLFLLVLVIMGIICHSSKKRVLTTSIWTHLVIGIICTLLTLVAWSYENRRLIRIGLDSIKTKKEKTS